MPVTNLNVNGKEIILIGTVHVSKNSAEEVREVIDREQPDSVCVELCQSRYESITERDKWKNTDIISIVKEKKAGLLFVNLLLSSFQKRIANK
ncbi:MAG: TraB domain-containing protein, partial [Desulfotomaculaceae bacterium]